MNNQNYFEDLYNQANRGKKNHPFPFWDGSEKFVKELKEKYRLLEKEFEKVWPIQCKDLPNGKTFISVRTCPKESRGTWIDIEDRGNKIVYTFYLKVKDSEKKHFLEQKTYTYKEGIKNVRPRKKAISSGKKARKTTGKEGRKTGSKKARNSKGSATTKRKSKAANK